MVGEKEDEFDESFVEISFEHPQSSNENVFEHNSRSLTGSQLEPENENETESTDSLSEADKSRMNS